MTCLCVITAPSVIFDVNLALDCISARESCRHHVLVLSVGQSIRRHPADLKAMSSRPARM